MTIRNQWQGITSRPRNRYKLNEPRPPPRRGGTVNRRGLARRAGMAALALLASGLLVAADAPVPSGILPPNVTPKPAAQPEELDEVLVQGRRTRERPKRPGFRDYQEPFDFLARLVGRFVIDGRVDLHATGR